LESPASPPRAEGSTRPGSPKQSKNAELTIHQEVPLSLLHLKVQTTHHRAEQARPGSLKQSKNAELTIHQEVPLSLLHLKVLTTHHRAEQALRTPIVNRKAWGGNQAGAAAQALTGSGIQTCKRSAGKALDILSHTLPWLHHLILPPRQTRTPLNKYHVSHVQDVAGAKQ
jgi:hypothetical protein